MRVLVIEDDKNQLLALEVALRAAGFAVDTAADLRAADEALYVNAYDCVVFDRKLPSGGGKRQGVVDALSYVQRKREENWATPVLFLTAMNEVSHRVDGLRAGGLHGHRTDYLVKPFEMLELVARVRNMCRSIDNDDRPAILRCADLELDTRRREVRRAGVLLTLTPKQFLVLERLMSANGALVSRRELLDYAWDTAADPASNVLDTVVAQLRRKLHDPPLLHTQRNRGYYVAPTPNPTN